MSNNTTLIDNMTTAVNTMTAVDARVTVNTQAITILQQQAAMVPVGYVHDANPTVPSDVPINTAAMIGATAAPVKLTNVAAGMVAAGSPDAVNGAQLAATNAQVSQNTLNVTTINSNLRGRTVVAVQYSDPSNPTVSNGGTITNDVALIGADNAAPVAPHNVAAGRSSTHAANVGQVQTGLANAIAISSNYTDNRLSQVMDAVSNRFAQVDFNLADLRRDANAGVAGAMAVSGRRASGWKQFACRLQSRGPAGPETMAYISVMTASIWARSSV